MSCGGVTMSCGNATCTRAMRLHCCRTVSCWLQQALQPLAILTGSNLKSPFRCHDHCLCVCPHSCYWPAAATRAALPAPAPVPTATAQPAAQPAAQATAVAAPQPAPAPAPQAATTAFSRMPMQPLAAAAVLAICLAAA